VLTVILAVVGTLLLIDGGLTLVWQEPLSSLYAQFAQDRLNGDLQALDRRAPSAAARRALAAAPGAGPRMEYLARDLQSRVHTGDAVGKIHIPRIGANFVTVAGTNEAALRKGPGIYDNTSFPGEHGTVAIAGHRTTYLAPFRRLNELAKGSRVSVDMPYGHFEYVVQRHQIVAPTEVSVLASVGTDQLVLTACHPLYSAAKRWVVFANLVSSVPLGAALNPAGPVAVDVPAPLPDVLLGNNAPGASSSPAPAGTQADELLLGPHAARKHAVRHVAPATPSPVAPIHVAAPLPRALATERSLPHASSPGSARRPAVSAPSPHQGSSAPAPQHTTRAQERPGGAAPSVGQPGPGSSSSESAPPQTTLVPGG